ncbi:MAG TPA: type II secretion system protein [Patescibacteria group bacterium]|nr:type II secretion system protein [Patescibacteria group bacterium]
MNIHSPLRNTLGFTMIELLVVISIIGILAVAVLSAINPIEQINKGRDTSTRSDAGELLGATERYFSIHEEYPWNETRAGGVNNFDPSMVNSAAAFGSAVKFSTANAAPGVGSDSTNGWNFLYQLSDTQEVKPAFSQRVKQNNKLVVLRAAGNNESTYVCFTPSSYAFRLEAAKNCSNGSTQQSISGFQLCTTAAGGPVIVPAVGYDYICLP